MMPYVQLGLAFEKWYFVQLCFGLLWPINSVKPFKSKNRDKIDLDAPNLKNVMKRFSSDSLTNELLCVFTG